MSFVSATRCHLGEGPLYCDRRDTLYWFDILEQRRYAYDFKSGIETFINLPEMASAMAVLNERYDVIFTESGLWLHEVGTGCWSPLCNIEPDDHETRSNDARVHPSGAMWLGTMGKHAQTGAGAIYHFRDGALTKLFNDITIPNSICFSPDGRTGYFTDTKAGHLNAVALDTETGMPDGEPRSIHDHSGFRGGLDGSVCDGRGDIWNAQWGASILQCYGPDGDVKSKFELPVTQPSCPAFVGGGKVAITSAYEGLDDIERASDPNAGRTMIVDLGVPERFEPRVVV
ncbi:MAG: SMP-30/gluconolactonase/LRE family protein [Pseudomonadota bacterium]